MGGRTPDRGATWSGRGRGTSTSRAHHRSPNGADDDDSTVTVVSTPRRSGMMVTATSRAPRAAPLPGAAGPVGRSGRIRNGRLATMVSAVARPTSLSDGEPVQVTLDRMAGSSRGDQPDHQYRGQQGPTACTHPDPLEWATPAQANMVTTLPTTGATTPPGGSGDADGEEREGVRLDPAPEHGRPRPPATGPGQRRAHVVGTGVSAMIRATRAGPVPAAPLGDQSVGQAGHRHRLDVLGVT